MARPTTKTASLIAVLSSACWLALIASSVISQEPADENTNRLAEAARKRAEGVQVAIGTGDRKVKATVHPTPLMKYTDVPRRIDLATMWIWQDEGRPVAIGKVEAYQQKGQPMWLYCFASASTDTVEGTWADGHEFRASKPGIEWKMLNGPVPNDKAAGRLLQMKDLFRWFTATSRDTLLMTTDVLRPLARPLHEYSSPKYGITQGVLCGFAANGTNPDVIVALEAVTAADGKGPPKAWRYGVVGMTASGISVKLDDAEVFNRPYAKSPGEFETWTYFWEKMPPK